MKLLIAFVIIHALPMSASACLVPSLETQTLLTALPAYAMDQREIVAKVRILQNQSASYSSANFLLVKVIQPIKGDIVINQHLTVKVSNTSCARDIGPLPQDYFYIAGQMNNEKLFIGEWRGLERHIYWSLKDKSRD
jgi:hypothetical protein